MRGIIKIDILDNVMSSRTVVTGSKFCIFSRDEFSRVTLGLLQMKFR